MLVSEHRNRLMAVENLRKLMSRYLRFKDSKELHLKALPGMKRVFGSNVNQVDKRDGSAQGLLRQAG